MTWPDIDHQRRVRSQNVAQIVHVAGTADAKLQHPEILLAVHFQNGQGQADLIVQIAKILACA